MPLSEEERKARKRETDRRWRAANRDRVRENNKQHYEKDLDASRQKGREKAKRLRESPETREKARASTRRWQAENPEKARASAARYYAENREKVFDKCRRWAAENREHINAKQRARNATAEGKIEVALRNASKRIKLYKGSRPGCSIELLGCTVAEARAHIEAQFAPGMTWENHGEWEIDHIKPIAGFDLTDPEQVRACAHYTNLQPLWMADNRSKGARSE